MKCGHIGWRGEEDCRSKDRQPLLPPTRICGHLGGTQLDSGNTDSHTRLKIPATLVVRFIGGREIESIYVATGEFFVHLVKNSFITICLLGVTYLETPAVTLGHGTGDGRRVSVAEVTIWMMHGLLKERHARNKFSQSNGSNGIAIDRLH